MKILTVVGARPQFIKCAPVSKEIRKNHTEILVHTGQHYDDHMSKIFFEELDIPKPDYNLEVGSGSHAVQTGHMMMELEAVIIEEKPDFVLIYGDTNSTLAGALVASKLKIPIGHVEAGVRNFDLSMPEEINRVVADNLSTYLFCPTFTGVRNLLKESNKGKIVLSGDVMCDAVLQNIDKAHYRYSLPKEYIYCTLHRPSNVDDPDKLEYIIEQLRNCEEEIVFPIHPRTKKNLRMMNKAWKNINFLPPVPYLENLHLIRNAKKVVTDSGGIQKEAYIIGTPCITVFDSTAWKETVDDGWNKLIDPGGIIKEIKFFSPKGCRGNHYGAGNASKNIATQLNNYETSYLS